jgi:hypothetical protein
MLSPDPDELVGVPVDPQLTGTYESDGLQGSLIRRQE